MASCGIAFVGDFGGGKTSCAVYHGIKMGMLDKQNYLDHCATIELLNDVGYNVQYAPTLLFGDVSVKYKGIESVFFPMSMFKIPNDNMEKYPYKHIPPYTIFIFDEAYWAFDSRKSLAMDKYTKYALNTRRHNDVSLLFTAPRLMQLDKDIRDTLDCVYQMLGVKTKKCLITRKIKTIWKAIKYTNQEMAEKQVMPDTKLSVIFARLQLLNIFLMFTPNGLALRQQFKEIVMKHKMCRYVKIVFNDNVFQYYDPKGNRYKWLYKLECYEYWVVRNVLSKTTIEEMNKIFFEIV